MPLSVFVLLAWFNQAFKKVC